MKHDGGGGAIASGMVLAFLIILGGADAGAAEDLAMDYLPIKPSDFFDWKFAQKVWFEMNTTKAWDAEFAKYAPDFKAWYSANWYKEYEVDQRGMRAELAKYPEPLRTNIERGFDMQLAYDNWLFHVYGEAHDEKVFREYVKEIADRSKLPVCEPKQKLNECGPEPDWRNEPYNAERREWMHIKDFPAH